MGLKSGAGNSRYPGNPRKHSRRQWRGADPSRVVWFSGVAATAEGQLLLVQAVAPDDPHLAMDFHRGCQRSQGVLKGVAWGMRPGVVGVSIGQHVTGCIKSRLSKVIESKAAGIAPLWFLLQFLPDSPKTDCELC